MKQSNSSVEKIGCVEGIAGVQLAGLANNSMLYVESVPLYGVSNALATCSAYQLVWNNVKYMKNKYSDSVMSMYKVV